MVTSELGEYRAIGVKVLDSTEYMRLSADARLMLFILKLRLGPVGIASVIPAALAEDCGYDTKRAESALSDLESNRWIVREGRIVWLRNGLRYDPYLSTSNLKHVKHIELKLMSLPRGRVVRDYCAYYGLRIEGLTAHYDNAEWAEIVDEVRTLYNIGPEWEPVAPLPPVQHPTPKEKKRGPVITEIDYTLADLFISQILEVAPGAYHGYVKQAKGEDNLRTKWADEIRKMRTLDHRDPAEIAFIFKNYPKQQFWARVLNSPTQLRGQLGDGRPRFIACLNDLQKLEDAENGHRQHRAPALGDPAKYRRIAAAVGLPADVTQPDPSDDGAGGDS